MTHLAAFSRASRPWSRSTPTAGSRPGRSRARRPISARFRRHVRQLRRDLIPLPGEVPAAIVTTSCRGRTSSTTTSGPSSASSGSRRRRPAGDATFLRRASLDVIGRLPTPDEARSFLADPSPDKRARLVDRLLDRPEYADHWANKWVDLLRPEPLPRGDQGGPEPRRLDPRRLPPQPAVRPVRPRDRHGAGSTFRARAGDDLPRPPRARRDRADGQPALPRHPARMRQVPPSSVRVVGPGAVLRVRRLLRPGRPQGDRPLAADLGRARRSSSRPSRGRSSTP